MQRPVEPKVEGRGRRDDCNRFLKSEGVEAPPWRSWCSWRCASCPRWSPRFPGAPPLHGRLSGTLLEQTGGSTPPHGRSPFQRPCPRGAMPASSASLCGACCPDRPSPASPPRGRSARCQRPAARLCPALAPALGKGRAVSAPLHPSSLGREAPGSFLPGSPGSTALSHRQGDRGHAAFRDQSAPRWCWCLQLGPPETRPAGRGAPLREGAGTPARGTGSKGQGAGAWGWAAGSPGFGRNTDVCAEKYLVFRFI